MKSSILAATALLLGLAAMPAGAAQSEAQASAPAPGVNPDAQCAMFMRNIIVQLLVRGNLTPGQRVYFDRYGVLFAYYGGRFSIGHDPAASVPLLTSTARGLSSDVQDRMTCYNGGDRAMQDAKAQIERAVPSAPGQGEAAGAAPPAPSSPTDAAGEDARCIAAVQRLINQRARLNGREEMRNYNRVTWTVDYLAGRMVARGATAEMGPAVAAAFAALPADEAAADASGFRCVADNERARDALSDAIAVAETAAEAAGAEGK